jgi:hypothetical protein
MDPPGAVEDINSDWQRKVDDKVSWGSYKRTLLKMPDKHPGLGREYFNAIVQNCLGMDLSDDYYYKVALDLLNSLVLLRKIDSIIQVLQKITPKSPSLLKIVSEISPSSIFFYSVFKQSSEHEIIELYPSLLSQTEEFISNQLPLKCKLQKDVQKLIYILKYYKISDKSLETIVKIWANELFLTHSLHLNQSNV